MNTTERKYVEKVASKAYVACYVQWTSTGKGSFKEALNSLCHLKCNLQFSYLYLGKKTAMVRGL